MIVGALAGLALYGVLAIIERDAFKLPTRPPGFNTAVGMAVFASMGALIGGALS